MYKNNNNNKHNHKTVSDLCAHMNADNWPLLPVFKWMKEVGNMEPYEMAHTFNCGIGMMVVVNREDVVDVMQSLHEAGEAVFEIGQLESTMENNGKDVVLIILTSGKLC